MRRILRRYAGSGYGFALLWHALTFLAGFIYSGIAGRWKFVERTVSAGKDIALPWGALTLLSVFVALQNTGRWEEFWGPDTSWW